jgi:hypothetical protein
MWKTIEIYIITIGSAALISFLTNLNEMNGNDWTSWTWVGWSRFFGTIGVQVLIAWKALTTILPPPTPSISPSEKPKE